MKFRLTLALTLFVILSCNKSFNTDPAIGLHNNSNAETLIRGYINDKLLNATGIWSSRLAKTVDHIDFHHIQFSIMDKYEVIAAPVYDMDVNEFKSIRKNTTANVGINAASNGRAGNTETWERTKVVFFLEKGRIVDANIIRISSAKYDTTYIDENFIKIINAKKSDFSGTLSVNALSQYLVNEFKYVDGRVRSSSVIKFTAPESSASGVQTNSCKAWYIETTYFFDDGTTIVTREDLGILCDDPDQSLLPPDQTGGSSNETTFLDSVCDVSNRLKSDNAFTDLIARLTDSTSLPYEVGYTYKNGNYYHFTSEGSTHPNILEFSFPYGPVDGLCHSHYAGLVAFFDALDIQTFYRMAKGGYISNPATFTYTLVPSGGNSPITLQINDINALIAYGDQNLTPATFDSWASTANFGLPAESYSDNFKNLAYLASLAGFTIYEKIDNTYNSGWQKITINTSLTGINRKKCLDDEQ